MPDSDDPEIFLELSTQIFDSTVSILFSKNEVSKALVYAGRREPLRGSGQMKKIWGPNEVIVKL